MGYNLDKAIAKATARAQESPDVYYTRIADIRKRARESYLRTKARKEAELKSLNLQITDIPADVLAAIELDCRLYRETRIAAALRRIGEAKLIG